MCGFSVFLVVMRIGVGAIPFEAPDLLAQSLYGFPNPCEFIRNPCGVRFGLGVMWIDPVGNGLG